MINLSARTKELKEMFAAIGKIADEIKLNISPEGIKSSVVNPENTCLLCLDLPKGLFNVYNVDETREIGMELNEWKAALQFEDPKDIIQFELEIKTVFKGANNTGETYESIMGLFKSPDGFEDSIAILDPTAMRKEPKIHIFPTTATIKIPTERFRKILRKASMRRGQKKNKRRSSYSADHYLKFIVENGEFTTTHEAGIRKGKSKTIALGEVEITGKAHACYSTDELMSITNTIKDKKITIEFADDYPLTIHFKIMQQGSGLYILAPRVEDEPRHRSTPTQTPPQTTRQDPTQNSQGDLPLRL